MADIIYVQKIRSVWYVWATNSENPRGAHMDDAISAQTEQEAMDEAEGMSQFEYEGEIETIELLQEGENVNPDPDDPDDAAMDDGPNYYNDEDDDDDSGIDWRGGEDKVLGPR